MLSHSPHTAYIGEAGNLIQFHHLAPVTAEIATTPMSGHAQSGLLLARDLLSPHSVIQTRLIAYGIGHYPGACWIEFSFSMLKFELDENGTRGSVDKLKMV